MKLIYLFHKLKLQKVQSGQKSRLNKSIFP